MPWALLWLAALELRRARLRSGLTALALAVAILAMTVLEHQTEVQQDLLVRAYEAAGAGTFLAELHTADEKLDDLARAARDLNGITAAEAPYRSGDLGLTADISFLVFQNDKQQEYLGATTAVLGVSASFDLRRDYYEALGTRAADAAPTAFGIPLLVTDGMQRQPSRDEVLVPAAVAEYVGVRPGALAKIEVRRDVGGVQPNVGQYEAIRVIGVFDAIGPDEGRFAPFWRLSSREREVLTVRRPDSTSETRTTLPIVLNAELLRDLLAHLPQILRAQRIDHAEPGGRRQLVLRANSTRDVPAAQRAVKRLLADRGLSESCPAITDGSFCIVSPEQNNFATALREQAKFGAGAGFFAALLLALVAIGNAGLQLQAVISRWHDHAVLQALGFTPAELLVCTMLRLFFVFAAAIAGSAVAWLLLPAAIRGSSGGLATAGSLCSAVSLIAAVATLLWPLCSPPGKRIRELA